MLGPSVVKGIRNRIHIQVLLKGKAVQGYLKSRPPRGLSWECPDPLKLGGPADAPSPALKGTLSPSDGERDGVRGHTSIPWSTPVQACGSGFLRLRPERRAS